MFEFEKIDLHMHTTVSDGTDSPETISTLVKAEGISLFSVTDHDAVKGSAMVRAALSDDAPEFIPGAEFSCKDENGKYHILGYGYDPDSEGILKLVEMGHSYRMKKVRGRLEFLKQEFGFDFPEAKIEEMMGLDNPGKPHIGNLMVSCGYAETKEQAIKEYINKIRFPGEYVRPEEAIEGILSGGGVPVLAHPSFGDGDQLIIGDDMDQRLRRLMEFGLQGVEAFYSGFTEKLRNEMLFFADKYSLFVTAGSDYHGLNKLVWLGDTGLGKPSEWPEGLRNFLERVLA